MPGWLFVALFLVGLFAYVLALWWTRRQWLSERWSATRAAITSGVLMTVFVGYPLFISAVLQGENWIVALLIALFFGGIVVSNILMVWRYMERHGVREELRRLFARKRS